MRPIQSFFSAAAIAALAGLGAWAIAADEPFVPAATPIPGGEVGQSVAIENEIEVDTSMFESPSRSSSSGLMTLREHPRKNGNLISTFTDGGFEREPSPLNEIELAKFEAARAAIDLAEAAGTRSVAIATDDDHREFSDEVLKEKDRMRMEGISTPLDHVPGGAK